MHADLSSCDSVRKRMSVIVRMPDGKVKVLAKGADTTMMPLLREDTPKVLVCARAYMCARACVRVCVCGFFG